MLRLFWTRLLCLKELWQLFLKRYFNSYSFFRPVRLESKSYNFFNKTLPQCNIKVIFKSKNRLSNLFQFKGSNPKELCSQLVYKCLCSNFNITYYGETERHLNLRTREHLNLSSLTGDCVKGLTLNVFSTTFSALHSFYKCNVFKVILLRK